MSDIRVGDVVVVVGSCCERLAAQEPRIGSVHTVEEIEDSFPCYCEHCGFEGVERNVYFVDSEYGAPLQWLKRIPPLAELQTWRQTDETTV